MTRPRVVLAEDHPVMAKALQLVLEEEFEVVGVAMTALALVEIAIQTAPDVIVSDITMPEAAD